MTVLRTSHNLKHQASAAQPRPGPHAILSGLWKVVAGSLLIDPLLWSLPHPVVEAGVAERGALLCALVTIPFLNQAGICSRIAALRKGNKEAVHGKTRRARGLFLAALVAVVLLKPLLVGRVDNVVALIFLLFVLFGAIKSVKAALEKERATRELFKDSPLYHISQWQAQLVTVVGIPFMLARAVSLFTTWSSPSYESSPAAIVGFMVSCALLAMLKPERRLFIGSCSQCRHPVPIVFVDYGSCPRCDERLSPPC